MPIFKNQADRLLRESWRGPRGAERLSQELRAIFMSEAPLQIEGPVEIRNGASAPAITITQNTYTSPAIPPILIQPPAPGSPPFQAAPVVVTDRSPGAEREPVGRPSIDAPSQSTSGPTRFRVATFECSERHEFMGVVIGGAGSRYTIDLEDNERDEGGEGYSISAPSRVSATCRQIAEDAQIPFGTFVPNVIRLRRLRVVRRTYFDSSGNVTSVADAKSVLREDWVFQVPVWL